MRRSELILILILAFAPACPQYELCVQSGLCPDVALVPTKPQPKPPLTIEPNQSTEHAHCAQKRFCIDRDDAYCCADCGGVCP